MRSTSVRRACRSRYQRSTVSGRTNSHSFCNAGLGSVLSSMPTSVPKAATPQRVRVSQGVSQGLLVHKVTPQYPPLARQARIQGVVVLQALIGKDGGIQNLHVVSGHPMLTNSALEAVKEWKYKPYYLNGEPVEVETTINVNFSLSGE